MLTNTSAFRFTRAIVLAAGGAASLSACYVIPMNPDGSPAWQYLPPPATVAHAPAAYPVVAVPAVPPGPGRARRAAGRLQLPVGCSRHRFRIQQDAEA